MEKIKDFFKNLSLSQRFHKKYYDSEVWLDTRWFGVDIKKCPLDMWIYQEIIHEARPDAIIECGTDKGGSAFFMAHMLDLLGKGQVISIDIEKKPTPKHKRITYLVGSSNAKEIVDRVKEMVKGMKSVMVILDSNHSQAHVTRELEAYAPLVSKNNYLIVEDTNLNGHPVNPSFGPGPMEAVKEFLKGHEEFMVDKSKEKFFVTFNPHGYLKKVK